MQPLNTPLPSPARAPRNPPQIPATPRNPKGPAASVRSHHDWDEHERLDDVREDERRVRKAVSDVVLKKERELQHAFLANSGTSTHTKGTHAKKK